MDRSGAGWVRGISGGLILGLLLLGVLGCQGTFGNIGWGPVSERARIPVVSSGEQKGSWIAPDLAIRFRYAVAGNDMDLSGVIQFRGSMAQVFPNLNDFFLQVFFVDSNGTVLGSTGVASSGRAATEDSIRFSKRIPLPASTAGIAFGYRGTAYAGGSDVGSDAAPFWDYPMGGSASYRGE